MRKLITLAAAIAAFAPSLAFADVWQIKAKVTMAEASHVGYGDIYFTLDQPGGNCPVGTYFRWQIGGDDEQQRIANGQAAFATLVTAKVSGQKVRVVGDTSGCTAQLLYLEQ